MSRRLSPRAVLVADHAFSLALVAPGKLTTSEFVDTVLHCIMSDICSGHLLCGVSRWSPRSIIASATFFTTALITANAFQAPVNSDKPAYTMALPSTPAAVLLLLVVGGIFLVNRARRRLLTSLSEPPQAVRIVPYFLAGLTFSLGLSLSGMISPLKVISFLRILPPWTAFDPSLAIIILTGVLPNALHYAHFTSNSDTSNGKPKTRLAWESWQIPHRTDIDWKLLLGAALFGVGWGLGGVCPGPAIVSLGQIVVNGFTGAHVSGALRGWVAFMGPLLAGLRVARAFV